MSHPISVNDYQSSREVSCSTSCLDDVTNHPSDLSFDSTRSNQSPSSISSSLSSPSPPTNLQSKSHSQSSLLSYSGSESAASSSHSNSDFTLSDSVSDSCSNNSSGSELESNYQSETECDSCSCNSDTECTSSERDSIRDSEYSPSSFMKSSSSCYSSDRMPGNGKLDTNAVANRIEKWLNDIRTAIEKHSFQRRIVQPSNGNDDQPVDQDEQSGENIATWLTDERMTITMGQVKREFSGLTSDNLDPVIKSDIEELVRKMTSYELVTICQKIDFCIVKSGLAETGIFLYELIHKLGLQDTTITEPKTRVMISTLIGSLHRSIGPTTPLHILVHFMGDLDETLEKVKKNPRDSSLKLDNMISLSCYLVASKSCSTKFLETILTKIGHCSEEKIKKNLNRVLQLTNCVLDKPNQLRIEKVLAPYRSKIECDQIKPSSSKSSKSKK